MFNSKLTDTIDLHTIPEDCECDKSPSSQLSTSQNQLSRYKKCLPHSTLCRSVLCWAGLGGENCPVIVTPPLCVRRQHKHCHLWILMVTNGLTTHYQGIRSPVHISNCCITHALRIMIIFSMSLSVKIVFFCWKKKLFWCGNGAGGSLLQQRTSLDDIYN